MKRIISTILLFFIPVVTFGATFSVSPSSQTINVGSTFSVSVMLDTQGVSIDGTDIRYLNFNPVLLQVEDSNPSQSGVQISPGSLMPITLANSVDNGVGRITFSQVSSGGNKYQGSGTLATIIFKALSSGEAGLSFNHTTGNTTDSNVAANGLDLLSSVVNGSYNITSSSGGGSSGGGGSSSGGSSSGSSSSVGSSSGSGTSSGGGSICLAPALSPVTSVVGQGSKGENVTNLQKFLVSKNYMTADNVTGFFGPATLTALQSFQKAEGIVSFGDPLSTGYGNAGPSTRARINALITTSSSVACTNTNTQVAAVTIPGILVRALGRGSEGQDVVVLQNFLIGRGLLAAGNSTGYFGPLTEAAVKSFQRAEGIVSSGDPLSTGYGNVGPSTRAKINSLLGVSSSSNGDVQSQIQLLQAKIQQLMLQIQNSQQ
jgi:peptidoglycan hydrolase-like protein with peptidoglycan-binding domain